MTGDILGQPLSPLLHDLFLGACEVGRDGGVGVCCAGPLCKRPTVVVVGVEG